MDKSSAEISIELSRLIARQTEFLERAIRRPLKFKNLNGLVNASESCLPTWRN